ncbi:M61 family peptidase [bacterium]|nr:M61 family peptidase [bacterium]
MKFDRSILVAGVLHLISLTGFGADAPAMKVVVDARDLPRRLVHTTIDLPCEPGPLALWYPKWIPGTHGPKGRIEDIAGLRVETADGTNLPWKRDEVDLYRFLVTVPPGAKSVRIRLDTACEPHSPEMSGVFTYGTSSLGIVNWNTCLLYPEGYRSDDQPVQARLTLPEGWKSATSLKHEKLKTGEIVVDTVSLTELIDSPVLAGRHLRSIPLDPAGGPPVFLDIVSESPQALLLAPKVVDAYSKMVREAMALFGSAHYREYHLLVVCSEGFGRFGLEHLGSSMNGVPERALVDDKLRKGSVATLLPHEYAHSWCGKYRRPAEMITADFRDPQKTKLLWVYEGLDTWLGDVLAVRSGLVTADEYRYMLNDHVRNLTRTTGREWRPLEDTAVASHRSRYPGQSWNQMRRRQDYYHEGMLIWYEADALIRERTDGKKSLDDFCRSFFAAVPGKKHVAGFALEDVVRELNAIAEYDWDRFFRDRVEKPQPALPREVVGRLGYRLKYADTPPPAELRSPTQTENPAADTLGLAILPTGQIGAVDPGMPADKAGVAPGMKVIGVNGRKFSLDRLRDGIADSVTKRGVTFLIEDGEEFRTIEIPYTDGLRYLELERAPGKPDVLAEILKPRAK